MIAALYIQIRKLPLKDQILSLVNFIGPFYACLWATLAIRKGEPTKKIGVFHKVTAAYCGIYMVAYVSLVFGPVSYASWSFTVSCLNAVHWFVLIPAWARYRVQHHDTIIPKTPEQLMHIIREITTETPVEESDE